MSDVVIQVEHLSKSYQYGTISHGTLHKDLQSWWARLRGKEDPNTIVSHVHRPGQSGERFWALHDISFDVRQGEIVGIIGRNGAGKSTLLKIISEITTPTIGCVKLKGRVGSLLEVGTGFHPELTGRENIYLNGAILGMSKREITKKFDEIVAFAEIEEFIDTPVKRYSSGMYVRLAFAVAAHLEPEILLVDEVLAVGDLAFQKKCLGKMGDVAQAGRTVIFVSHNMTSILQLCSQAIWLDSGKIVKQGDARTVVLHYSHDNRIPLGEVVFDPSGEENGAALLRVYVMDENQCIRPDIPYSNSFYIVFEYRVEYLIDGLRVGFRLYNERNIPILQAATSDCPSLDNLVGKPGQHCARAKIPADWFAPGRYYAELGIWSPKVGHHQHLSSAFAFDITNTNVDSMGEDVLRPILNWSVA